MSVVPGNTAIVGPLPVSWANMTSLQALDVSSNCGICGNLPTFPPSVLAKLQVESQGSGLGWTCNKNACAQFPISILAQAGAPPLILSASFLPLVCHIKILVHCWKVHLTQQDLQQGGRSSARIMSWLVVGRLGNGVLLLPLHGC